jgi:hypothetical protein
MLGVLAMDYEGIQGREMYSRHQSTHIHLHLARLLALTLSMLSYCFDIALFPLAARIYANLKSVGKSQLSPSSSSPMQPSPI